MSVLAGDCVAVDDARAVVATVAAVAADAADAADAVLSTNVGIGLLTGMLDLESARVDAESGGGCAAALVSAAVTARSNPNGSAFSFSASLSTAGIGETPCAVNPTALAARSRSSLSASNDADGGRKRDDCGLNVRVGAILELTLTVRSRPCQSPEVSAGGAETRYGFVNGCGDSSAGVPAAAPAFGGASADACREGERSRGVCAGWIVDTRRVAIGAFMRWIAIETSKSASRSWI